MAGLGASEPLALPARGYGLLTAHGTTRHCRRRQCKDALWDGRPFGWRGGAVLWLLLLLGLWPRPVDPAACATPVYTITTSSANLITALTAVTSEWARCA